MTEEPFTSTAVTTSTPDGGTDSGKLFVLGLGTLCVWMAIMVLCAKPQLFQNLCRRVFFCCFSSPSPSDLDLERQGGMPLSHKQSSVMTLDQLAARQLLLSAARGVEEKLTVGASAAVDPTSLLDAAELLRRHKAQHATGDKSNRRSHSIGGHDHRRVRRRKASPSSGHKQRSVSVASRPTPPAGVAPFAKTTSSPKTRKQRSVSVASRPPLGGAPDVQTKSITHKHRSVSVASRPSPVGVAPVGQSKSIPTAHKQQPSSETSRARTTIGVASAVQPTPIPPTAPHRIDPGRHRDLARLIVGSRCDTIMETCSTSSRE